MKLPLRNILLLVLMLATAFLAIAMRPTRKIADQGPQVALEIMVPLSFGDWQEEKQNSVFVVDPQQQATLDRIYTQTLSRTYVDKNGYRIMLSIAYGSDQRDGMQTHYPEVCYPAQGFQVISNRSGVIHLPRGNLPVTRIETGMGAKRYEPVTYWTMVGDTPVLGGTTKKIAEMRYGLQGEIPDGLLFRVSSLDKDSQNAFRLQETFITEILAALPPQIRKKLSGS